MIVPHGTIWSTHLARFYTFADGTSILAQLEAVLAVESTHDGRAGRRHTLGLTQLPGVEPVVVAPTAAVDKLSTDVPSFVEVPAQQAATTRASTRGHLAYVRLYCIKTIASCKHDRDTRIMCMSYTNCNV